MEFGVEISMGDKGVVTELFVPGNDEPIVHLVTEEGPKVYEIKEALQRRCGIGARACGASVDLWGKPDVSCPMVRCPLDPRFNIV